TTHVGVRRYARNHIPAIQITIWSGSGLAGVLRVAKKWIWTREILDIESVRDKAVGRGPAVELKGGWLKDEGTPIVRIQRHLDLMGDRGRDRGDRMRHPGHNWPVVMAA